MIRRFGVYPAKREKVIYQKTRREVNTAFAENRKSRRIRVSGRERRDRA